MSVIFTKHVRISQDSDYREYSFLHIEVEIMLAGWGGGIYHQVFETLKTLEFEVTYAQEGLKQVPGRGHPDGKGSRKFCVVRNVRFSILSTYKVPCRWSISCCSIRAFHPVAVNFKGCPSRPRPVTSTSKCRSTRARYPSTLHNG